MPDRRRRSYSLRGQLGILFAALAIPLLLLQVWWSYHDYRSAREQAWDDALAFADAVDLGVRQFMEQSGELLRLSAEQSGPTWLDAGRCTEDMEELQALLPFDNVLLIDGDGSIVCSAAPVPPAANAVDWGWYAALRRSGDFTVGPPVQSDLTGAWILPLVAPIHGPEGGLRGGLAGTVSLMRLSGLLGSIRPDEDRLTTLATPEDVVIARSVDAERWLGRHLPPATGSDRLVAPGRWVAEGPDLTGVPRTWGQVRTESGWIVYVGVPDAVVFGPARREALVLVGGTLLVVLVGLILGTLSYSRIARALRELAEKTRASGAGEVVPLLPETPQEIAEVLEQYNHTLEARTQAKAAERAARERFQSIFDNAAFGIYVSTPDGRFLQVNPALVEMLGYPSEEALMEAGAEALYPDPEVRQRLVAETMAADEVRAPTHELEWLRADGTPIVVRIGGKVLEGPHGEPVFEMVVQDITEEKRTEDQLRQTQKMEAIGQLAGGVAHDFNNLLTVIGGNVELLEGDLEDGESVRLDLEQIAKATQRASSLTQRLLTFSRPSRQGVKRVDVNEVLPELSTMLVPIIGETVSLRTEMDEGPNPISIDPGELEQLVVNLVLNARDALAGQGEIVVAAGPATRETDGTVQEGVVLSVTDNGRGMEESTRLRAFEPFFTTKAMGEGTGLGLSTVYGIVQRAGGEITVDSEPGRGTRIEVWLPRHGPAEEITPVVGAPERSARGESILVVEDDDLVRTFVGRALVGSGFDVLLTGSGEEALELVRERGSPVDLVLTDVVMPSLSGPELAERLAVEAPDTPVLFMSGYIENDITNGELVYRPDILLKKPFTLQELLHRVREALDQKHETGVGSTDTTTSTRSRGSPHA